MGRSKASLCCAGDNHGTAVLIATQTKGGSAAAHGGKAFVARASLSNSEIRSVCHPSLITAFSRGLLPSAFCLLLHRSHSSFLT